MKNATGRALAPARHRHGDQLVLILEGADGDDRSGRAIGHLFYGRRVDIRVVGREVGATSFRATIPAIRRSQQRMAGVCSPKRSSIARGAQQHTTIQYDSVGKQWKRHVVDPFRAYDSTGQFASDGSIAFYETTVSRESYPAERQRSRAFRRRVVEGRRENVVRGLRPRSTLAHRDPDPLERQRYLALVSDVSDSSPTGFQLPRQTRS